MGIDSRRKMDIREDFGVRGLSRSVKTAGTTCTLPFDLG